MEKTLKVPFGEVNIVRVRCKDCVDAAIEIPLAALVNAPIACPGCGKEFRRPDVDKAVVHLANAMLALQQKHQEAEFQFVLPLGG